MREEIEKTGAEINEAALGGVDGGADQESHHEARIICSQCRIHSPGSCNGGSVDLLADFPGKVSLYTQCPYYRGPVG